MNEGIGSLSPLADFVWQIKSYGVHLQAHTAAYLIKTISSKIHTIKHITDKIELAVVILIP